MKDKEKQRNYVRQHYVDNKKYYYDRNVRLRAERRAWFNEYMQEQSCLVCGEDEICCLDHHHLDPSNKEFNIASYINRGFSLEKLQAEIAKCVVICSNCHRKFHHGLIAL